MPKTSLRTAAFAESVIRGMTRLANECGAINLSQGFPDFQPPEVVLQALERVSQKGPHQYAVTWGAPSFRAALARKQSRFMQLPLDPDENIVVTCGSTEAMMVAMMTACNPGDKVIVRIHPLRDGSPGGSVTSVVLPDGRNLLAEGQAPGHNGKPANGANSAR